jgi:hypothetical protein
VYYRADVQKTYRTPDFGVYGEIVRKPGDTELIEGREMWGTVEAAQRQATTATKHFRGMGKAIAAYDAVGIVVEVANSKIQGKTVAGRA